MLYRLTTYSQSVDISQFTSDVISELIVDILREEHDGFVSFLKNVIVSERSSKPESENIIISRTLSVTSTSSCQEHFL